MPQCKNIFLVEHQVQSSYNINKNFKNSWLNIIYIYHYVRILSFKFEITQMRIRTKIIDIT